MKWKKFLCWTIAVIITLGASIYQRMTGPTHPKYAEVTVDGESYRLRFPRSGSEKVCIFLLSGLPDNVDGKVHWKRFPSSDPYNARQMTREAEGLQGVLPVQPPAGKLTYYVELIPENAAPIMLFQDDPLVIRFKGDVPAWVLIPHILLMFVSMLFACYAGLCALANLPVYAKYVKLAFWTLVVGGFVFGPLLQYYAFGMFWSGFPFDTDLTDNKTLIAGIGLLIALLTRKKTWNRWAVVGAVLLMFGVFSIPHSIRGSELNHETGQVETSK